jgi:hypothetical protein
LAASSPATISFNRPPPAFASGGNPCAQWNPMLSLIKGSYESESFLCPPLPPETDQPLAADAQRAHRKRLRTQLQVAMVAHALAAIKNRKFGGQVNAERIALLAMYHDASEVLTGDLPTPVKYFNSQIAQEYKAIEKIAQPGRYGS